MVGVIGYGEFSQMLSKQPNTLYLNASDGIDITDWVFSTGITRLLYCAWQVDCETPRDYVDLNCRPLIYLPQKLHLIGYISPVKIWPEQYTFNKAILGSETLIKGYRRYAIYRLNYPENLTEKMAANIMGHFSTTNGKSLTINCRNFSRDA